MPLQSFFILFQSWKARVAGYDEARRLFQSMDSPKSKDFIPYLGLMKKFVTDSNAVAQEKGLIAALAFVENAADAGRYLLCFQAIKSIVQSKSTLVVPITCDCVSLILSKALIHNLSRKLLTYSFFYYLLANTCYQMLPIDQQSAVFGSFKRPNNQRRKCDSFVRVTVF